MCHQKCVQPLPQFIKDVIPGCVFRTLWSGHITVKLSTIGSISQWTSPSELFEIFATLRCAMQIDDEWPASFWWISLMRGFNDVLERHRLTLRTGVF